MERNTDRYEMPEGYWDKKTPLQRARMVMPTDNGQYRDSAWEPEPRTKRPPWVPWAAFVILISVGLFWWCACTIADKLTH